MTTNYLDSPISLSGTLRKVYLWMTVALAISGGVAWYFAHSPAICEYLFSNQALFWGLFFVELALVIGISAAINRLSAAVATILFILYSIVNGVFCSLIFFVYTAESLAGAFFVTAGTFAAMSLFGYTTKKDLSGWGRILLMALIGVLIATVVNIFFASTTIYWIATYVGLAVFIGITAYDTQKIKLMIEDAEAYGDPELEQKIAIIGALALYLDFINIFLYIIRIFGKRK